MTDVTLRYLLFGEDKSASAAIEGTAGKAHKAGELVSSSFSKIGNAIGGEVGEVMNRVSEGFDSLGEAGKGMGSKLQAGGVAAAGLGAGLQLLGAKDKEADNQLRASVEATGKSMEDYEGKFKAVIKEQENYGHTAAQTTQALATLTQATKDPQEAIDKMGLAANLAAAQHISLQSAAVQVGKAVNGSTRLFKQYGISVDSVSSATTKLHHAQDDLAVAQKDHETALQHLHDVQDKIASGALSGSAAQSQLSAAQDEASRTADSLTTKQDGLAKAQHGLKEANDTTKAGFEELSKRVDGQASASMDSFSGKLTIVKTKVEDAVAAFGNKFGPAITIAGALSTTFGTVMQVVALRNTEAAVATEAETVATEGQSIASKAAAAAQWLLNAAMEANPIGLIVVALVGLVALFVLLWKHSETFRTIVTAAFDAVKGAASATFGWIEDHWKLILGILTGPIGAAVIFIVDHWGQIVAVFHNAVSTVDRDAHGMWDAVTNGLGDAAGWVHDKWDTVVGWVAAVPNRIDHAAHGMWSAVVSELSDVESTVNTKIDNLVGWAAALPGRVTHAVAGMWGGIRTEFANAIDAVIRFWNGLHFHVDAIKVLGKTIFPGADIGVPTLPLLAKGGVLTSAGDVIVGDAGPERLTLPQGARVTPLSASSPAASGSDGNVTLTVIVRSDDGRELQRKLLTLKRNNGGATLGLA